MSLALVVALLAFALLAGRLLRIIWNWKSRTGPWIRSLVASDVLPSDHWGFNDFLSITGFFLTLIAIFVGWRSVRLENTRISIESQVKGLTETNADLQQRLRVTASGETANFAQDVDIHLELPRMDSVLTGINPPELQWQYSKHTDSVNYVVRIVKLDPTGSARNTGDGTSPCDFEAHQACTFFATNPAAQRSKIKLNMKTSMSGRFLWRVVPVSGGGNNDPRDSATVRLSEWSEYGSFEIYENLKTRIEKGGITVGTTYSDNNHFTTIDQHGESQGHDIDLIRLLVECLAIEGTGVAFRHLTCNAATEPYRGDYNKLLRDAVPQTADTCNVETSVQPRGNGFIRKIRAFPTVEAGLAAVRRKDIDIFVGAVTKAAEREKEGLRFTSGYYPFHTALYAHGQGDQTLEDWARVGRTIGVIANSTNHWLATALSGEPSFGDRLTIVAYPTYWSLKNSFENRDIDGLLIDSVLGNDLIETKDLGSSASHYKLTGLEQTSAWQQYIERLGYPTEEFAIAVAAERPASITWGDLARRFIYPPKETQKRSDLQDMFSPLEAAWGEAVRGFFYLPDDTQERGSSNDLFSPLEAALESPEIQYILPALRRKNCVRLPEDLH